MGNGRCFGDKGDVEDITEGSPRPSCSDVLLRDTILTAEGGISADIISTVEFDHTGNYLATGDKGEANYGYRDAQSYADQARIVKGRAFYQNGNTWTDATAQEALAKNKQLKQRQVKFNSDEYFGLLKSHPEAAQWLSLGDNVDVVIEETLYQVRG